MLKNILNGIKNWFGSSVEKSEDKYKIIVLTKKDIKKLKLNIDTKKAKHYLKCTYMQNDITYEYIGIFTNTMPNIWKQHSTSAVAILKLNEFIELNEEKNNEFTKFAFERMIGWITDNDKEVDSILVYDKKFAEYGTVLGFTKKLCTKTPRTVINFHGKIYDSKLIYQKSKKDNQLTKLALRLKHALHTKKAKYERTEITFGYILNIKD